ncbi:hypothetical protein NA57DRAFT_81445 [Rhizodiscina lignyota]|uniref:BHLH domain-containing protein n=1 Tax=Rhizodiscina lignyota TaxID=1504668 RepID=A0A9P4I6U8_9PEZI|nr:hypothetical protein NA57DRAFT_81445 [Rhizodiscina lignyota]
MSSPKGAEKPRLTEKEKKNNHIASEQKRRQAIREGFDRLATIVPGMEGQGRSEAVVLQATLEYMRAQIEERKKLLEQARMQGLDTSGLDLDEETMKMDTTPRKESASQD